MLKPALPSRPVLLATPVMAKREGPRGTDTLGSASAAARMSVTRPRSMSAWFNTSIDIGWSSLKAAARDALMTTSRRLGSARAGVVSAAHTGMWAMHSSATAALMALRAVRVPLSAVPMWVLCVSRREIRREGCVMVMG
jgi:hypothetical protein